MQKEKSRTSLTSTVSPWLPASGSTTSAISSSLRVASFHSAKEFKAISPISPLKKYEKKRTSPDIKTKDIMGSQYEVNLDDTVRLRNKNL